MSCSCKAQCLAHCRHSINISLEFPFPLVYQCRHLKRTFVLIGHLHKMVISNSPSQLGKAEKGNKQEMYNCRKKELSDDEKSTQCSPP